MMQAKYTSKEKEIIEIIKKAEKSKDLLKIGLQLKLVLAQSRCLMQMVVRESCKLADIVKSLLY